MAAAAIVTATLALFLLFGWLCVQFLIWVWWKPMKLQTQLRKQGINGPSYKFFYGNLKDNSEMMRKVWSKPMDFSHNLVPRILPFLDKVVKENGKISFMWIGPTPRVFITDPELIKEVLSNKFGHFEKPKPTPLSKMLAFGLASIDGEKWATHRRILNPAFHQEKLKTMVPAFLSSCEGLVKQLEGLIGTNNSIEIDMWQEFQNLTGDVIARTAFGSNFDEGKQIFQAQAELAKLVLKGARSVYIPGSRFLPTKDNRRRKELSLKVRKILIDMIVRRESAMKAGEPANDDLLGLLLESNNNSVSSDHKDKPNMKTAMSIDDVIEECKLFYFAGMETTSVLLTWTIVMLSMNPHWQTKAREEVLQIFGKNQPDFDGLSQLKTVTMILYEVLRLYSPAVQLTRRTYKEIKLGDFCLPPGVQLCLPILAIHHEKELWGEDALEFNPERFSNGISKACKHPLAFFPFGWGPRICIGQNFALVEAKLALSLILQNFSFELSPSYAHAPYIVVTLHPKRGVQVIVRKV